MISFTPCLPEGSANRSAGAGHRSAGTLRRLRRPQETSLSASWECLPTAGRCLLVSVGLGEAWEATRSLEQRRQFFVSSSFGR